MRCKNHLQLDVRQHKNGGGLNVVKSRTSILNFENSYIYFKYNNNEAPRNGYEENLFLFN